MSLTNLIPEVKQLDATVVKSRARRTATELYLYDGIALCWPCIREDDSMAWRDEDLGEAELTDLGYEMLGENSDHMPTLEALSALEKSEYFQGTYCPQRHGIGQCAHTNDGCMSQE